MVLRVSIYVLVIFAAKVLGKFFTVVVIACVDDAPSALCNAVHFKWVACNGSLWLAVGSWFVPDESCEGSHGLGLQCSAYGLWSLLVVVELPLSLLKSKLEFPPGRGNVGVAIVLDVFGKSGDIQGVVDVVINEVVVQVDLEIVVVTEVGT